MQRDVKQYTIVHFKLNTNLSGWCLENRDKRNKLILQFYYWLIVVDLYSRQCSDFIIDGGETPRWLWGPTMGPWVVVNLLTKTFPLIFEFKLRDALRGDVAFGAWQLPLFCIGSRRRTAVVTHRRIIAPWKITICPRTITATNVRPRLYERIHKCALYMHVCTTQMSQKLKLFFSSPPNANSAQTNPLQGYCSHYLSTNGVF